MEQLPDKARKWHRFLVKIMVVLGLLMAVTGSSLYFYELPKAREIHRFLAPFFNPVLILMIITGLIMYFQEFFGKKFGGFRLLKKELVAKETMAFYFSKPAGFVYKAGQYGEFKIRELSHLFTFSSAPEEKEIMLATRLRPSPFKNALQKIKIGEKIVINGPFGRFILPEQTSRPLVFLAGGIGITPFFSMIKAAESSQKITLLYSNRTKEETTFLTDLEKLKSKNFKLKLIFTATEGHLTWEKIKKESPINCLYYLCGPSGFVQAMKEILLKNKVSPQNFHMEQFSGY